MRSAAGGIVVVGIGESPAALGALRYGVSEARRRGVPLRAVRVWRLGVPWSGYDVLPCVNAPVDYAVAVIRRAFDWGMGGMPRDLEVQLVAAEGATGKVLVAQAGHHDDLLVVGGSQRRWWLPAMASVPAQCVRLAHCPVVVVPVSELARAGSTRTMVRALERESQRYADARVGL